MRKALYIGHGRETTSKEAIDAGLPIIIPTKQKYSNIEKPPGKLFDACANVTLLLVSPQLTEAENNLTKAQCQELNDIAQSICGT